MEINVSGRILTLHADVRINNEVQQNNAYVSTIRF